MQAVGHRDVRRQLTQLTTQFGSVNCPKEKPHTTHKAQVHKTYHALRYNGNIMECTIEKVRKLGKELSEAELGIINTEGNLLTSNYFKGTLVK